MYQYDILHRKAYISIISIIDIMDELVHIRIGKELKKQMKELMDSGLFSNQAEIAREGIRALLLKYKALKNEKR